MIKYSRSYSEQRRLVLKLPKKNWPILRVDGQWHVNWTAKSPEIKSRAFQRSPKYQNQMVRLMTVHFYSRLFQMGLSNERRRVDGLLRFNHQSKITSTFDSEACLNVLLLDFRTIQIRGPSSWALIDQPLSKVEYVFSMIIRHSWRRIPLDKFYVILPWDFQ